MGHKLAWMATIFKTTQIKILINSMETKTNIHGLTKFSEIVLMKIEGRNRF